MANKTAILKYALQYETAEGQSALVPPNGTARVQCPYQAQSVGSLDVPDTTTSATSYSIPFGSIGVAATLVVLENKTGQELAVKINGASSASHRMKDGGVLILGEAAAPGTTPITAVSVATTATQSGAGFVAYYVFGDPT